MRISSQRRARPLRVPPRSNPDPVQPLRTPRCAQEADLPRGAADDADVMDRPFWYAVATQQRSIRCRSPPPVLAISEAHEARGARGRSWVGVQSRVDCSRRTLPSWHITSTVITGCLVGRRARASRHRHWLGTGHNTASIHSMLGAPPARLEPCDGKALCWFWVRTAPRSLQRS
jgi:hypothetical protein